MIDSVVQYLSYVARHCGCLISQDMVAFTRATGKGKVSLSCSYTGRIRGGDKEIGGPTSINRNVPTTFISCISRSHATHFGVEMENKIVDAVENSRFRHTSLPNKLWGQCVPVDLQNRSLLVPGKQLFN